DSRGRARGGARRPSAGGLRIHERQLGSSDRAGAVRRVRICVRGDLGPDPRGTGRRGRARPAGVALMPPLGHYLILSAILFSIGTAGVFIRRNVLTILLAIEIMLNAVNLSFVAF